MDLNCDMGELISGKSENFDNEIMPFISSCNIACGFHSGNPALIEKTIKSAINHGVRIGAHPSYNDRENFGRKSISVDLAILIPEIRYQISALKGMVESLGGKLSHVKPHGALYNDMVKNKKLAKAVIQVIKEIDPLLAIFGLADSDVLTYCAEMNMKGINEGFADRTYEYVDELRNRQLEGAVLTEKESIIKQIDHFLDQKVQLYNDEFHPISVDSICLHSDTEGAVILSRHIYEHLKNKNVTISGS